MKKDIVISIEELMNPDIITSLYLYGEKSKPNENLMLNNSILTKKDIHVKIDI